MEDHKYAVEKVAASVQQFHKRDEPFRIYHGSTNSTRQTTYSRENSVDISCLSRVVKVDATARTVLVEPNVPMDRLVEATLEHGLIPPVVMEFPESLLEVASQGLAAKAARSGMLFQRNRELHRDCAW